MDIDYNTLTDLAGADGHCLVVPLYVLDYLFFDKPWNKPRFIKNAVPKRHRRVVYGIENPYHIPEFYDTPLTTELYARNNKLLISILC